MSQMHNPSHPGAILREDVLPALGLSVTDAADALGVTRIALSRVLNEHAAVSEEMALRLERWLGADNGGEASVWLAMQSQYNLWHARKAAASKIRRIKPAKIVHPAPPEHARAVRSADRDGKESAA